MVQICVCSKVDVQLLGFNRLIPHTLTLSIQIYNVFSRTKAEVPRLCFCQTFRL